MCDTMVALGDATTDGSVILARNSDREPDEAHLVVRYPHAHHAPDDEVRCTYITIPQAPETYEVLLCKPFWLWGCEMGANEKGVAIGNEAVFTKEDHAETGLLGMDLMRLALERADTAEKALQVIVDLLGQYGQGGACGYLHKGLRYHNSFIIADTSHAWVLETAGKYWAAERVRDVRTISNGLTIGHTFDLASPGLVEHAIERGWCKSKDDFHFARCYSDFFYTHFSRCRARQRRSTELLRAKKSQIAVETMMSTLRDHGQGVLPELFRPARSSMASLCMHAANELTRSSQSTGAMVAHLEAKAATVWVTGTSATCTSVFKPVYLNGLPLPEHGPVADGTYDADTLWWHHERLHRATLRDYPARYALYRDDRDALEADFIAEANALRTASPNLEPGERARAQAEMSQHCFDRARGATTEWIDRIESARPTRRLPWLYRRYWNKQARQAGFPPKRASKVRGAR